MIENAAFNELGSILAIVDGVEVTVPDDMANRHRQMIAEWEDGGGVIAPYAPPALTVEDYRLAIQDHVDTSARSRNYNDGTALAGYKDSTVPQWSSEAIAFIAWRDAVWVYAYDELDKVMAGERSQPTVEVFIGELPALEWPPSA